MKQIKELTAKEGMYLTQVADVQDRIFISAIKGFGVNETDWRDATEEEKVEWEKAHEIKKDA